LGLPLGNYQKDLLDETSRLYELAARARQRSLDPSPQVDSKLVFSHGQTIEYLIGLSGLADRYEEWTSQLPHTQVPFKIAEDVVYGRFGSFSQDQQALLAIKAGVACITPPGTTAAPIEGIASARVKQNYDRSPYLAVYFAGPMRSAGGTEQALSILIGDFVKSLLHLSKYVPTKEEVARFVEEFRLYERRVSRFQYRVPEEQLMFALERMPIEVTGVRTDPVEVVSYRNLPRIETNFVRGGALRVLIDGFIGRSSKVMRFVNELNLSGWDWLESLKVSQHESTYMDEVLVGRPAVSSADRFGGLRIRYGRARNTGLASVGVHPVSMIALDSFIAVGSQMRMDRPGKSSTVMPVDSIEPPVVRLDDGSVVRVTDERDAERMNGSVSEILFVGDVLISAGDYIETNHAFDKPAFVEEWWASELRSALSEAGGLEVLSQKVEVPMDRLRLLVERPLELRPGFSEASRISARLNVPLHPAFIHFWERCDASEVFDLLLYMKKEATTEEGRVVVPRNDRVEAILDKALVTRLVKGDKMIFDWEETRLLLALSTTPNPPLPQQGEGGLDYVSRATGLPLKMRSGSFVSARIGRPEAAKLRRMKPPVQVLFPVGNAGGPTRDVVGASGKKAAKIEIAERTCPSCGSATFYPRCPDCGEQTKPQNVCQKCGAPSENSTCKACGGRTRPYSSREVDLNGEIRRAQQRLGLRSLPGHVKGVKSLFNDWKIPEQLEKGLLRAIYKLSVYKDGTCRFDASNAVLTAFKPSEISAPIPKLLDLGYDKDIDGRPLATSDQILPLKVQDIILPKRSAAFLVDLAAFLDRLLALYGCEPYYNVRSQEDLIGKHVISISPHTVGGVVGRILGFTPADVLYAHPYYHQAKRRDCDGDADSFTLALDVFLNLNKAFMSERPGGRMDSPLVVFPFVNPREIDDQVYNMEDERSLSAEFYRLAETGCNPSEMRGVLNLVGGSIPLAITATHTTSAFDSGPKMSRYRSIDNTTDKLMAQISVLEKLPAVDKTKVLQNMLDTHLMRDFSGNVKALYTSGFRCAKCGAKFRRPPISGHCNVCGCPVQPNVYVANVLKYYDLIKYIAKNFDLEPYYLESIKALGEEAKHLPSTTSRTLTEARRSSTLTRFMDSDAT